MGFEATPRRIARLRAAKRAERDSWNARNSQVTVRRADGSTEVRPVSAFRKPKRPAR